MKCIAYISDTTSKLDKRVTPQGFNTIYLRAIESNRKSGVSGRSGDVATRIQ